MEHQNLLPQSFYSSIGTASPIYEQGRPPVVSSQNVRIGGSYEEENFFNFPQQQQQPQHPIHQRNAMQQNLQRQPEQHQQQQRQQQNLYHRMLERKQSWDGANSNVDQIPGNFENSAPQYHFNNSQALGKETSESNGDILQRSVYGGEQSLTSPLNQFQSTNQSFQQMNEDTLKLLSSSSSPSSSSPSSPSSSLENHLYQQKLFPLDQVHQHSTERQLVNLNVNTTTLHRNMTDTNNPSPNLSSSKGKSGSKKNHKSEERYKKSNINTVFSSMEQHTSVTTINNTIADQSRLKETRYENTVSALKKARLMDITLQTGELVKKSNSLQKDIDMLEEIVKVTKHLMSN